MKTSLESKLKTLNEMKELQEQDGNWNYDDYMCGMYNGMEFAVALMENREPVYKTLRKEDNHVEAAEEETQ